MIDTLKLANRLSSAGMERRVAETLAEELNDQLRAEIATRSDLASLRTALQSDLSALFWRSMAGVAVLLLGHLAAVWGIIAAQPEGRGSAQAPPRIPEPLAAAG